MHKSVMDFGWEAIRPEEVTGKDILEVGSMNVNGTLSSIVDKYNPRKYIGTDMRGGPGVDLVCPAEELTKHLAGEWFDIVICTEMLEHCLNWKEAIQNIFAMCKPNGVIILTARGPGAGYHPYPEDYWRFTLEDIRRIFEDNEIVILRSDPEHPGFLAKIRKTGTKVYTDFDVEAIQP